MSDGKGPRGSDVFLAWVVGIVLVGMVMAANGYTW